MPLFLSMAGGGPEWMFFLVPIVAILLLLEGSKRLYRRIVIRRARAHKIKIGNFRRDEFDNQLN